MMLPGSVLRRYVYFARANAVFLPTLDIVPTSSTARVVAARLVASAGLLTVPPAAGVAAEVEGASSHHDGYAANETLPRAEQLWSTLASALSAWCGPFAYHALLSRALVQAQAAHSPLAALRVTTPSAPQLEGLRVLAGIEGGAALAQGSQDLLTSLIELLARVIGDEMAVDTVSQAVAALRGVPADGHQTITGDAGS